MLVAKNTPYQGTLITFEGGEGCGKSTQINRIAGELNKQGLPVSLYKEPGSTDIGNQIRTILLDNFENTNMAAKTEFLLFEAARAQIIEERVRPDLKAGKIVLLDRHSDSTDVHQGFSLGLGVHRTHETSMYATGNLIPDLTLFMDVDAEVGLSRRRKGVSIGEDWNRLDDRELDYHKKVNYAYKTLYAYDQEDRWVRVDANKSIDEVYRSIYLHTRKHLREVGLWEGFRGGPERRG